MSLVLFIATNFFNFVKRCRRCVVVEEILPLCGNHQLTSSLFLLLMLTLLFQWFINAFKIRPLFHHHQHYTHRQQTGSQNNMLAVRTGSWHLWCMCLQVEMRPAAIKYASVCSVVESQFTFVNYPIVSCLLWTLWVLIWENDKIHPDQLMFS